MPKLLQARLRARGLPQPQRLQRLPPASGCGGVLRAAGAAPQLRGRAARVHGAGHPRRAQSRAVKKNIIASSGGTVHRAGALLEDAGPDRDRAARSRSTPATSTRAFCVFKEWHRLERADRGAAVSPMTAGSTLAAGVRVAPAERRRPAGVRHLPGRRRPEAGRRDRGRERVGHRRRQHPQRARAVRRPDPGADLDVRGPEWSYDAHQAGVRRPPGRRQRPGPVAARRRGRHAAGG